MNTAYLLIVLMMNTNTNTAIGAQTFELNNVNECKQMQEYAHEQFKRLPPEIKATTGCFPIIGGKSKDV